MLQRSTPHGSSAEEVLIADTSVLINFLAADRVALLAAFATRRPCRLLITEHVEGEVSEQYPDQHVRLRAALAAGTLTVVAVDRPEELETFARLGAGLRLGRGECSAIAVAMHRGFTLAIDDRRARRDARALSATLRVVSTQDLVVAMIRVGVLDVLAADALKEEWANRHRFRLPIVSFRDVLQGQNE